MTRDEVVANSIDVATIRALAAGEIAVMRVPGWYEKDVAARLGRHFLTSPERKAYGVFTGTEIIASDHQCVGPPFNHAYPAILKLSAETVHVEYHEAYYDLADRAIISFRRVCVPFRAPVDQLLQELATIWPTGAGIAQFEGRRMFFGIARILHPGATEAPDPHVDWLPPSIKALDHQLSALVYLTVPPTGGELEVWHGVERSKTYEHRRSGLKRELLSRPITIVPDVGDLVIINSRLPHAVRGFKAGVRCAQQCFIGLKGGEPLQLWS